VDGAGHARARARWVPWLLLGPALLYVTVAFAVPLLRVLVLSVTDPVVSLAHYRRIFTTPLYLAVLATTFRTSLVVTLVCLALGYPLAYVMARRGGRLALALLVATGVSFWTSFLVRTYSWMVILGAKGPVTALAALAGMPPPQLLFTTFASTLGMTHILLPYMVMALYAVMK
jgi:putative spermidine/putrescine transport system permease protein